MDGMQNHPLHPEEHRDDAGRDYTLPATAAAHEEKALAFSVLHPAEDLIVFLQSLVVFDSAVYGCEYLLEELSGFCEFLAPRIRFRLADKDF